MNMDLERVKSLTLNKIEKEKNKVFFFYKRPFLVAAIVAALSVTLLGAERLFDWKVMVNNKIQQGNFGDTIFVGDGYAAMSLEKAAEDEDTAHAVTNFPDSTPDRTPKKGELSLFVAASDDNMSWTLDHSVTGDETLDLNHIKSLAKNAEATIYWPQKIDDNYKVIEGFTRFYLKADQLKKAKEVYSFYSEWKNQQIFELPDGYDKNVRMMSYGFQSPSGDNFRICAFNAISDAAVYGGSGSAVIEKLELDGFESVVFVSDDGVNTIHSWRKTKKIKTVNPEEFGKKTRPENNMIDKLAHPDVDADVLSWQSFDISSETMSKDELLDILKSISL